MAHTTQPDKPSRLGLRLFASTEGADALRIVFMRGHGDRAAYHGLFLSCRTGRDWVLTNATEAILALQLTDEQLADKRWQKQLDAAQQALATRGQVHRGAKTALVVRPSELRFWFLQPPVPAATPAARKAALDSLVSFLQQAGQHIDLLKLENPTSDFDKDTMLTLLQRAAPALHKLASLELWNCTSVLPPPSQLPSLRLLVITTARSDASFRSSVTALLPQLTDFRYRAVGNGNQAVVAAMLMACEKPLQGLANLTTLESLNDALLSAVVDRCPALQRLEVTRLELANDKQKDKEWALRELAVDEPFFFNHNARLHGPQARADAARATAATCGRRGRTAAEGADHAATHGPYDEHALPWRPWVPQAVVPF